MIRISTFASMVAALLVIAPACAQEDTDTGADPDVAGAEAEGDFMERVDRSRMKGAEGAPVQIVEISDFQCGFCARFATETMPAIDSAYIESGQVQFLYVHYPLPMHEQSYAASEAALCAGGQGEFWSMHDRIFETREEWIDSAEPAAHFEQLADEVGVDRGEYRSCVENDRVASLVINDVLQIARAGISGTPAFIINGETLLQGHQSFEEMSQHIEQALAQREGGDEGEGAQEEGAEEEGAEEEE